MYTYAWVIFFFFFLFWRTISFEYLYLQKINWNNDFGSLFSLFLCIQLYPKVEVEVRDDYNTRVRNVLSCPVLSWESSSAQPDSEGKRKTRDRDCSVFPVRRWCRRLTPPFSSLIVHLLYTAFIYLLVHQATVSSLISFYLIFHFFGGILTSLSIILLK